MNSWLATHDTKMFHSSSSALEVYIVFEVRKA